jgi:hypothetical protein
MGEPIGWPKMVHILGPEWGACAMLPRNPNPAVVAAWHGKLNAAPSHAFLSHGTATTPETAYWRGYALARTCLNREMLAGVPRTARVLEVGVDKGVQLRCLASLGFHHTAGTHVHFDVMQHARRQASGAAGVQASGLHLPFQDAAFDLVCTSGLMAALCDGRLERLMQELHRCAGRWLWGWERLEPGIKGIRPFPMADRTVDFAAAWQESFPDLRILRARRLPAPMPGGGFQTFLLEKTG